MDEMEALMPTDELMRGFWVAALLSATRNEQMMESFKSETGITWKPARCGLDRMIDEATGADKDFVFAFVRWFNANVWGECDGRACNGNEVSDEPI